MATDADAWVPTAYREHRFDPTHEDEADRPRPPIRTTVRRADEAEIARRNEAEGTKRARRYLPVERATQMARTAKSAVRDRLISWAYHPDERVPLALLDNREIPAAWEDHDEWVADHLLRRALVDAEREGVHWTPLLDALSDWGAPWPKGFRMTTEEIELVHGGIGRPLPPLKPDAQFRKLRPWLESRTSADAVAPLFAFDSRPFLSWVAERVPVLSTELLEALLEAHPHTAEHFARNPHLTPDSADELLTWAHRFVSGEQSRLYGSHRWEAKQALTALHKEGVELTRERLSDLVDLVTDESRHETGEGGTRLDGQQRNAFWTLSALKDERLTAGELIRLYGAVHDNVDAVIDLLEAGLHAPEFLAHVAEHSSRFRIRRRLARLHSARKVEAVWDVLRTSTSARVMEELLQDATGEEFREIFREMAEADPKRALDLLESDPDDRSVLGPDLSILRTEDLVPLLKHTDRAIRRRALVLSATLDPSVEMDRPPTRGRRRR